MKNLTYKILIVSFTTCWCTFIHRCHLLIRSDNRWFFSHTRWKSSLVFSILPKTCRPQGIKPTAFWVTATPQLFLQMNAAGVKWVWMIPCQFCKVVAGKDLTQTLFVFDCKVNRFSVDITMCTCTRVTSQDVQRPESSLKHYATTFSRLIQSKANLSWLISKRRLTNWALEYTEVCWLWVTWGSAGTASQQSQTQPTFFGFITKTIYRNASFFQYRAASCYQTVLMESTGNLSSWHVLK